MTAQKPILSVLLGVMTALFVSSCQPESGTAAKEELSRDEIDKKLVAMIGTGLPKGATNVTIDQVRLSASIFDCGFLCSRKDLEAMVAASPKLSEGLQAANAASGAKKSDSPYYLTASWKTPDPKGLQAVKVVVTSIGEETVGVDLGTVFIPGL